MDDYEKETERMQKMFQNVIFQVNLKRTVKVNEI